MPAVYAVLTLVCRLRRWFDGAAGEQTNSQFDYSSVVVADREQEALQREIARLCRSLRRWPRWLWGHLEVAETALRLNDVGLAYGAAQAARVLARCQADRLRAEWLLGRCYLRRGAFQRAREILEPLLKDNPTNAQIAEDLAAACAPSGDYRRVVEILSAFDPQRLSPEAEGFLAVARVRVHGQSTPSETVVAVSPRARSAQSTEGSV